MPGELCSNRRAHLGSPAQVAEYDVKKRHTMVFDEETAVVEDPAVNCASFGNNEEAGLTSWLLRHSWLTSSAVFAVKTQAMASAGILRPMHSDVVSVAVREINPPSFREGGVVKAHLDKLQRNQPVKLMRHSSGVARFDWQAEKLIAASTQKSNRFIG